MKHTIWKAAGIVALLYVFAMAAFVRLGPGLLEIQVNETAQEATVTAFASHFSETADDLHVFVASGKQRHELPVLRVSDPTHVVVRWTLPDTLPTRSLNLFTNDPIDGTLLLENAAFVGESSVQVIDKAVIWPSISITEHPANLGFHFPYQPRIVESIRNLFLHVPLWFTMFLLAGIAFVGSVRQLGETGPSIHDERAEAATRVAVWFGVLGLITGSIWARGAWGAWWIDDPQLNGALVTVLVYSGYLVLRGPLIRQRCGRSCPPYSICSPS
jgi:heme exporter protein C